ncbi:hypothetical protein GWK47_012449 [Chionoecetes opilio]|uniref:Uncharacterized protein n=1 Tax=Chionoecetes opilio TaxID=41210 RepID=A0A8J4Y5H7_CHIOP|nr:hypothetical protein GWK47_012449 [Chionoecetes opilio]
MDTSNLEEEMKQISGLDEALDEDVLEMQKTKSAITLSKDELQLVQAAQNKQQHGHDKLLDPSLPDTKYLAPHQIKSEDMGDVKKRERKDTDDKKDPKEEDMAEEDENNEAIDAIFAQGGDITDMFMRDIISGSMKDDDANLTGDEDISQDTIDIPSGSGSGTKLTDILGPGFNLDDVADIMKNLPEDGAEDSQDSSLSTAAPPPSSLAAADGEKSVCADSERSVSSTPTASPATQTPITLPVSKESLVTPPPPVPITLPAASTLRPNQPPVAPLSSLPLPPSGPGTPVPPMQTVSVPHSVTPVPLTTPVSLSNVIQGPSPIPSMKTVPSMRLASPVPSMRLASPVPSMGLASPATHASPSALPSPLPSPAAVIPSMPQSLPSPLSRPDSQASSHGFCSTPTPLPSVNKPPTPTVPEPQKLWSSSDSQSQSLSLEEDESLGDKATKAAVLYVNVHKPNLKTDFPGKL